MMEWHDLASAPKRGPIYVWRPSEPTRVYYCGRGPGNWYETEGDWELREEVLSPRIALPFTDKPQWARVNP